MKRLERLVQGSGVCALAALSIAGAGLSAGAPPLPGKACGRVAGAAWRFDGQSGTSYSVSAQPAAGCGIAMRSIAGLTRQKAGPGAAGSYTLKGPAGYRCAGSALSKLTHGGFCVGGRSRFFWGPHTRS